MDLPSKRKIIDIAKAREDALLGRFVAKLTEEKEKLNGLTQLLGCIVDRFGQIDVPVSEIENKHPGQVYIVEMDGTWSVRLRDDYSKPVELSIASSPIAIENLDKDSMDADGVESVSYDGSIRVRPD